MDFVETIIVCCLPSYPIKLDGNYSLDKILQYMRVGCCHINIVQLLSLSVFFF